MLTLEQDELETTDTQNLFEYCFNDPINSYDPTGLAPEPAAGPPYPDTWWTKAKRNAASESSDLAQSSDGYLSRLYDFDAKATGNKIAEHYQERVRAWLSWFASQGSDGERLHALSQSTPAQTQAFQTALAALLTDPKTGGQITKDQANAISLNDSLVHDILRNTGRQIWNATDYLTWMKENSVLESMPDLRKHFPGMTDAEALEAAADARNEVMARTALVVDTNKGAQELMAVFAPTASLIIMAMDVPMLLGQAVRPRITPFNAAGTTNYPSIKSAVFANTTLTRFSAKVGEATEGILGGFIRADGTVDFVPFGLKGFQGHVPAQAGGAIPADALGGFSVAVNNKGKIIKWNFYSALNGSSLELPGPLQAQIKGALSPVTASGH